MTQKISPDVLASALVMASAIRSLSTCEIISSPSPASGRPAAPERAATAGKTATIGEPAGRAGGPVRARPRGPAARPAVARSAATAVARDGPNQREEHESEDEENQQHDQDRIPTRRRLRPFGRTLLPFRGVAGEHADDVVDTTCDAAREIAGAEPRGDPVLDDEPGNSVGKRALEAIAHLDAHLALVRRHDQQHAVVLALLTDLPAAAKLVAEVLDRRALQRFERHHHELVTGLGFELGELLGERRACSRIQNAGIVDHAAGKHGKIERQRGDEKQKSERRRGRDGREVCGETEHTVLAVKGCVTPTHLTTAPLWRHSRVSSGTHRARCAIRILPAAASSRPPPP